MVSEPPPKNRLTNIRNPLLGLGESKTVCSKGSILSRNIAMNGTPAVKKINFAK